MTDNKLIQQIRRTEVSILFIEVFGLGLIAPYLHVLLIYCFNPLYRGVLIVTSTRVFLTGMRTRSFNPLYRGVLIVTAGAGFLDMLGLVRRFANTSFI